jgi:hypothetical protein
MTPARTTSHGLGNPPPLQVWLHAVLMLFAELVSHAISTLQMVCVRCTRECHTTPHDDLPRETSGIPIKETDQVEPTGFTTGSVEHVFPAQAGIQPARNARSSRAQLSPSFRAKAQMRRRPGTLEPRAQLVITEAAQRLSGTHSSAIQFAKWFPARAALDRDDNRALRQSLT